jgi:phosphatidylserine/phosphatidylglycerophosphate/cardiolipin synthase-like enzyme
VRATKTEGDLTVRAIAGTHVVVLAMNVDAGATDELLGFAIERLDKGTGQKAPLPNFLIFAENDGERPDHSSVANPIQAFQWSDYTALPGHAYTFTVTARYGTPTALRDGDAVEIDVETEDPEQGTHGIFFNRGAAGWQGYERKFAGEDPDQVPHRAAYEWLSRGLEEALLAFIAKADGKGWGLRAAFYEFNYMPALDALWSAKRRGVDVKLVVDEVDNSSKEKPIAQPRTKNLAAIDVAEIDSFCVPRVHTEGIPHNKFIVLLKDGKPVEVWTGSTNITKGGIYGHSNVGHIVRDEKIAAAYLGYWKELATDPDHDPFQASTTAEDDQPERRLADAGALLPEPNSVSAVFSPRESLDALDWYAKLMDQARESVFLTAPFGVSDQLEEVFVNDKDYLRYLLLDHEGKYITPVARRIEEDLDNEVAVGAYLGKGNWHQWLQEHLTGFNHAVLFIHTKYMLIDPLGDDPIVITGSANFSENSIRDNDENALVIRGDTAVADIYLSEFMRLFSAFRLRRKAGATGSSTPAPSPGPDDDATIFLDPTADWAKPAYVTGSTREKERLLFSGATAAG